MLKPEPVTVPFRGREVRVRHDELYAIEVPDDGSEVRLRRRA